MTQINLPQNVIDNCKSLNIELKVIDLPELESMAHNMAYEPMGYGTLYGDGTPGILVQLPEERRKYNNGVYMLHLSKSANSTEENPEYQYLLEVIVPNTAHKDELIQHFIGDITTHIENLDTSDLDVYDFAEIYGFVIANTVVKHLAKSLYPTNKLNQTRFTNLYMSRFLAHIAHIYAGSEQIKEEAVNSDPYLFKLAIDGLTDELTVNESVKETAEELTKSETDPQE